MTVPFCQITLGGKPVVDPPKGFGRPTNLFRMSTGAARYGRGQFLMLDTDYDAITLSPQNNGAVILFMTDGTNKLNLSVQIGGAIPAVTNVGKSPNVVEVIVFDLRTQNFAPVSGSQNYNVIAEPFSWNGDWNYWPSTLHYGTTAWTWAPMAIDMGAPAIPNAPSWLPRNMEFANVPLADAVDRIAAELFLVVGWDWTANSLVFYEPGESCAANRTWFQKNYPGFPDRHPTILMGGGEYDESSVRAPGTINVAFPVVNVDTTDPYAQQEYISPQSTGNQATSTQSLQVGNQPAFYQNGATQNVGDLGAIAADLATRAFDFMTQGGFAFTFSGIQLLQPDGSVREIVWESSAEGPMTKISGHNGRDFKQLADEFRTFELPANQLVEGIGGTQTSVSPAGTRYVWSNETRDITAKITSVVSYAGLYNGTIYLPPTTDSAAADLTMPDGMTASVSCLIINEEEDSALGMVSGGHLLQVNTYVVGMYGGMSKETPPRPIVLVRGGTGAIASTLVLPHGYYGSPDATTWNRYANACPVKYDAFWWGTDSGSNTVFMMTRTPTFDARGNLLSVSAEVQTTISGNACS